MARGSTGRICGDWIIDAKDPHEGTGVVVTALRDTVGIGSSLAASLGRPQAVCLDFPPLGRCEHGRRRSGWRLCRKWGRRPQELLLGAACGHFALL